MMRSRYMLLLALGAALVGPALAQGPGSALKGHDSSQPVDIAAERIEVQDRADRVLITGNVDVRQGNLRLNAPRITVAYASTDGIDIERIDATGGVVLRSPEETARSQSAVYDLGQGIVTMLGNVQLTRGGDNVQGGRLVIDLDTGRAVMDGGVPGAPGSAAPTTGRVTGRFTVAPRGN